MIKYAGRQIVFREFIDEVTLAIDLSLCPNRCIGCHSKYLVLFPQFFYAITTAVPTLPFRFSSLP